MKFQYLLNDPHTYDRSLLNPKNFSYLLSYPQKYRYINFPYLLNYSHIVHKTF